LIVDAHMQQKFGTAAEWASENPVLLEGELGIETDTGIIKSGDGKSPWNSLSHPFDGTYVDIDQFTDLVNRVIALENKVSSTPTTPVESTSYKVAYVAPTARGTGDGSTTANASGGLTSIVPLLDAGFNDIRLLSNSGAFAEAAVDIKRKGSATFPILIRGVGADGVTLARALISGARVSPYDSAEATSGGPVFRFYEGWGQIKFSHVDFEKVEECFTFRAPGSAFTLEKSDATNVRWGVSQPSGLVPAATVSGMTLRDVKVNGYSRSAFRMRYDTNNILCERVYADSQRNDGDSFTMAFVCDDTVHDAKFIDCDAHNNIQTRKGTVLLTGADYWNGDGFVSEAGAYNLEYTRCKSSGSTDGGFDLKHNNVLGTLVLTDCESWNNKRNYRIWRSDAKLVRCVARNPIKEGGSGTGLNIWIGEGSMNVLATNCILEEQLNNYAMFGINANSSLTIDGGSMTLFPNGVITDSEGTPHTITINPNVAVVRKTPGTTTPTTPTAPVSKSLHDEVLADGPVAFWEMNETTGTSLADSGPNDFDATLVGATLGVAGPVGKAISYDGVDDRSLHTTLGTLGSTIGTKGLTIEFWIKTSTTATNKPVILGSTNLDFNTMVQIVANTNADNVAMAGRTMFHIRQNGAAQSQISIDAPIYDDQWHHVVLVRPAGNAPVHSIYVDGVKVPSPYVYRNETGTSFSNFAYPMAVGAVNSRGTIGSFFKGSIDGVAFYDKPLTDAQVAAHYNAKAFVG